MPSQSEFLPTHFSPNKRQKMLPFFSEISNHDEANKIGECLEFFWNKVSDAKEQKKRSMMPKWLRSGENVLEEPKIDGMRKKRQCFMFLLLPPKQITEK